MSGLGTHYELVVTCRGDVDPVNGYLINIKEIDHAVRAHAVPMIRAAIASSTSTSAENLVAALARSIPVRGLHSLRWKLSPYYSLEVIAAAPSSVLLRQKFDFCAAHRLHAPQLSAEENRRLFGKCNNPSGHGHNYQFEPCVALVLDGSSGRSSSAGPAFTLHDLERLADELIVQRFDHKNLNTDTEEFRDGRGLNPSVENIARVCFDLLSPAISKSGHGAKLQSVTVWESDRTSCTYPG